MRSKFIFHLISSFAVVISSFTIQAQEADTIFADVIIPDTIVAATIYRDDAVLAALDGLWKDKLIEWQDFQVDSNCLNVYNYPADFVPVFSDSVMSARMAYLNGQTPISLEYNNYVKGFINLYAVQKRGVTSRVLGLAALYYPMFEEKLDQFDMPLELKHLAVVESALNASAKSRVGATGLWQFMYSTGKMYGLEVDTYVDDRSDPYASTIAACRYMKYLYGMYHDWNLVLAAYNSGPGNVNKAIRRSGGKKDFWAISPFLPKETRSYVPAFIAVNYIMNYATEHNLYPVQPVLQYAELDTVHICRQATMEQVAYFSELPLETVQKLNPSFKTNTIPQREKCRVVYLPSTAIGQYLANEDSLENFYPVVQAAELEIAEILPDSKTTHVVRSGESLGLIAQKHKVGVTELKDWNNLKSNNIHPGQKLVVQSKSTGNNQTTAAKSVPESEVEKLKNGAIIGKNSKFITHTIQSGDTLWDIANKYPGISVTDIKKANSGLNYDRLKPGQKIKIPPTT